MTAGEPLRCDWARSAAACAYHDSEWGVPEHDDHRLFELLILEGAQAGLSWETILTKRDRYRKVFDGFDPQKIARYGARKLAALLSDAGIVRNRLKIGAAVTNARACLAVQAEFGSFSQFVWRFVGGVPVQNAWLRANDVPSRTVQSDILFKGLKERGFTFVGTTICYAFMQATGMVNDHLVGCYRHEPLAAPKGSFSRARTG